MMASSGRHLSLLVVAVVVVAVATPRADAWGGGRFFFSKTTRPGAAAVDEPAEKTTTVPVNEAADPNGATAAFSRPSTGGSGGRGYGLYGRPDESFPPGYFRRGVHRNAEKLTTTSNAPTTTTTAAAANEAGSRGSDPFVEDNNGRGRAPWTNGNNNVPATTTSTEAFAEDNGSGWGRPPKVYGLPGAGSRFRRDDYGMSDTRLYQNGRYYDDVDAGRYGYGRESNPVRTTRPEEFTGDDDRRARHSGNAAAAGYYQYGNGNGNEFRSGDMENNNQDGFQEEGGRYIP
ncbi:hypothetical protein PR202_gb04723 [Eleusine coracana subsp. coracana]|uniref:Uncharacterized protein n=1 Tax=Eleusine coracana subsp. coracana TaxID=191504 RepID=A0AAV5E2R7_ELECO|nr:hypothetical protein QOZ80_1BG0083670 [Eleusine coracana subsp. coracana]GJN17639.1 hypothetical protein PR202_gb04723 [Eleusine coracana subsp. coracana]